MGKAKDERPAGWGGLGRKQRFCQVKPPCANNNIALQAKLWKLREANDNHFGFVFPTLCPLILSLDHFKTFSFGDLFFFFFILKFQLIFHFSI